jgi:hypothetical protein
LFQFIIFKNGAQSSAKNIHFGELHKILELWSHICDKHNDHHFQQSL